MSRAIVSVDSANVMVTPLSRYRYITVRSKAWLSGRNDSASSSSTGVTIVSTPSTLETTASWVSMTPFGSPVVPEV